MARRLVLVLLVVLGTIAAGSRGATGVGSPLYPDLQTLRPSGLYFESANLGDGLLHYLLRFSNTVWNAGEGRLELQGDPSPGGHSGIYQNLYDGSIGGSLALQRFVGDDFIYHPDHYHYHFEGFATYSLLKRDSAGVYQDTTRRGYKTSFCIIDYSRITSSGPSWAVYTGCNGSLQGLSVGWGDTYYASLPGQ